MKSGDKIRGNDGIDGAQQIREQITAGEREEDNCSDAKWMGLVHETAFEVG
jgi:hypothetical protein